jgi:anti-sigma factor RsiW
VLGTLPTEEAIAFEEHYLACDTCATVLYKTVDYVDAMRAAARKTQSESRSRLKLVGRSGNS